MSLELDLNDFGIDEPAETLNETAARIIITHTMTDTGSDLMRPYMPFGGECELSEDDFEPESGSIVFETYGTLRREGERISIIYSENSSSDDGHSVFISFDENSPDMVTMNADSQDPMVLIFNGSDPRCTVMASFGPFPFEITVMTRAISNTVTFENGGKLSVEYSIESHGIVAEQSRLLIKVIPCGEGPSEVANLSKIPTFLDKPMISF